MDKEERWSESVQGLRDGESRIVLDFCHHFGPLLEQIAQNQLASGIRRRVGPEDVAQSACRTFLRRAHRGEFEVADSEIRDTGVIAAI